MEKLNLRHGDYVAIKNESHLRYVRRITRDNSAIINQNLSYPCYFVFIEDSYFCLSTLTVGCINEIFVDPPLTIEIDRPKQSSSYSHYFKDVSNLDAIDVYRVCVLFGVDDASGAIHHAIKKLLCSGKRGAKDAKKDLIEARDAITRKLQMIEEDAK